MLQFEHAAVADASRRILKLNKDEEASGFGILVLKIAWGDKRREFDFDAITHERECATRALT